MSSDIDMTSLFNKSDSEEQITKKLKDYVSQKKVTIKDIRKELERRLKKETDPYYDKFVSAIEKFENLPDQVPVLEDTDQVSKPESADEISQGAETEKPEQEKPDIPAETENKEHEDMYKKLSDPANKTLLNNLAEKLGIKSAVKSEIDELINTLKAKDQEEVCEIFKTLDGGDAGTCDEFFPRLNSMDEILVRVVANDLKIAKYKEMEKPELIKAIQQKPRQEISAELDNDWESLFVKLEGFKRDDLDSIAKRLGISNPSEQERRPLTEAVLYNDKKRINRAISKAVGRRRFLFRMISGFIGLVGFIAAVATIMGFNYRDIIEFFSPPATTSLVTTSSTTSSSVPTTTSTTVPRSEKNRDSFAIAEAEKFFSAVKSAGSGVYGETNLPPGFSKNSDVVYEGNLTVDKNGISGKMMFHCPKSENRFTLDHNGVISPKSGDEGTVEGITFVWVPGGCFQKGCEDENCPGKPTCIEGFWLGKCEVTQGQWKKTMGEGSNPSAFKKCGDDCPVEMVSWNDVQGFLGKLGKENFSLPTEAQWEYACRYSRGIKFSMQEWCKDDYGTLEDYKSVRTKSSQCTERHGLKTDQQSRDIGFRVVAKQIKSAITETSK